jgi:dolichol-phosphate mannosyltransferase
LVYFIEVEHDSRIALFQRDPIMLPSPGRRSGAGPICSGAARGRSDILRYAIIIPVHDEADNVEPLLAEIRSVLDGTADAPAEILFVDDGSRDGTAELLAPHVDGEKVRVIRLARRCGKSAALLTGARAARSPWIVTMDGDRQNDPRDVPRLIAAARSASGEQPALVAGLRAKRRDTWARRFASRFANGLRKTLLGDDCPDTACGLKLMRRDAFLALPYFDGLHRFFPALFKIHGHPVAFLPVNDRPRERGSSKYGNLSRAVVGLADLLGVMWLRLRSTLPAPRGPE